ncbi:MAG TPA: tRNA (adenosine(37)-N6)-dimethylallyltransferase MiaA [Devosia sp.]|nr:tRNA (adenosine(37)-N6)-dimethylallyltransferase MiaA [Devosia sp.]
MTRNAILITGPTASGKSALAIKLAQSTNGVIINTDSMQVYSVLDVLSARPRPQELSLAPHFLYGTVSPRRRYSTGDWLRDVKGIMGAAEAKEKTLIFVGGTGLYFQALINGFTAVPPIPVDVVKTIEKQIVDLTRAQRLQLLLEKDPLMAERLPEADFQRVVRALSVMEVTGRSLALWQEETPPGLLTGFSLEKIVISPERDVLRERITARFSDMMDQGAVAEVAQLLALKLDDTLPVMKAIGVRQIGDWLAGRISKSQAIKNAATASHQYAKRQRTWFRKQMGDWEWRAF